MSRVATISAQLVLDSQRFDRTIRKVKKQFKTLATDSRAQMAAVGAVLGGVAVGLGFLSGELEEAGSKVVKLKKDLSATFDGAELDKITEQIRVLGATPPFSEEQFTSAAKSLEKFGKDVGSNLTRIGNIAVATGESFEGTQRAFAGFGRNDRATKQIEKILAIDSTELVKFGAVLDATGKSLDFTGANAAKAQAALEKFTDAKFTGAMDQVVTGTEALRGEFQLLTQDLGVGLAEIKDGIAGALLPFVQGLRDTSDETKKMIGVGVALTGLAAAAGAAAIGIGLIGLQVASSVVAAGGFAVVIGKVTAALGVAATTAGGFIVALAPIAAAAAVAAAVVVPLALAVNKLNKAMDDYVRIGKEALAIELRRASAQKGLSDLLGKTGQELRNQGTTAMEASNGILALQQRIELAREAGNDSLVARLIEQVNELREARKVLAEFEKGDRDQEAATQAALAPKTKEQLAEIDKQRKDALAAELDAIELRLAKEEITQKESLALRAKALDRFQAEEQEKRRLVIETARFEVDERKKAESDSADGVEKLRAQRLQTALDFLQQEKLANRLSTNEEVAALQRILQSYELTEQEKRSLSQQTAQLKKTLRDQDAAEEKKKADEARAAAKKIAEDLAAQEKKDQADLVRLQDRSRDQQVQQVDSQIGKLQEEEGVDNTSKIQDQLKKRLALQVESLRLEADRAKAETKNAEVIKQIEANLQQDIRTEIERTAKQEQDALKRQLEARKELVNETKRLDSTSSFGGVFGIEDLGARLSEEQNTTRRNQPEEIEIEAPDLEAIEQRLQLELTKVTAEAPALEAAIGNLSNAILNRPGTSAAVANLPSSQATPQGIRQPSSSQGGSFSGTLDLRVTVDSTGAPKLESATTSGLDGRYSEITRNARGMRGAITFG